MATYEEHKRYLKEYGKFKNPSAQATILAGQSSNFLKKHPPKKLKW